MTYTRVYAIFCNFFVFLLFHLLPGHGICLLPTEDEDLVVTRKRNEKS